MSQSAQAQAQKESFMNHPVFLRMWEKVLAIIVLVVSLSTSLIGAGYQLRTVKETESRIEAIEVKGSAQAQISAKDIEWLKEQNNKILQEVQGVRDLLLRHMDK
jgi:hypothetical protein